MLAAKLLGTMKTSNPGRTNDLKKTSLPAVFLVTLFAAAACSGTKNKISPADIKGFWYLQRLHTTFRTIYFDDSLVMDLYTDSILYYVIKGKSLVTVTRYGNKRMVNKIYKLTPDSLVLDGIHDVKEKRKYSRRRGAWD